MPQDETIDIREVFSVIWERKWLIIGCASVATLLSVIVVLILPNIYRAEALLAPNDQEGAGSLSALASQYGGLASLAGINLNGNGTDKTALGLEVLKSRKFIHGFVERRNLLVPLMATKGWDSETREIVIDSDKFDVTRGEWVRKVGLPRKTIPSLQEAYTEFIGILSIDQDKKTGFVRLSIEHYSPIVAKEWVDWLIDDLNTTIMRKDVGEAEQAIEYLNEQIASTSLAELQNVFFNLIEEQTKTVMLAKVSDEYLFKTLDPAVAPELKSRPFRSLIVILSALVSAFITMLYVLVSGANRPIVARK